MPKIKEQIPERFYELFASKYREEYITCLIALKEAVQKSSNYVKGMRKEDAIAIVNDLLPEEVDGTEIIDANARIVRLVDWGWLLLDYDDQTGENLITFPAYTNCFISLFNELNSSIEASETSLIGIYALINSCFHDWGSLIANEGLDYLNDALKGLKECSMRLTTQPDILKKYYESIATKENGLDILKETLDALQVIREVKESVSPKSSFIRYTTGIRRVSNGLEDKVMKQSEEQPSEYLEKILERIRQITFEVTRIEGLNQQNAQIERKTVTDIHNKYRYIATSKESSTKFDKLLRYLGSLKDDEKEEAWQNLCEKMSINGKLACLNGEHINPQGKKRRRTPEIVPIDVTIPRNTIPDIHNLFSRYSARELSAFEESCTIDGKVTFNSLTILTLEDFEKMVLLYFNIDEHSSEGRYEYTFLTEEKDIVTIKEGYSFKTFSYIKKEAKK